MVVLAKVLLAGAVLISLWFVIRGLLDMQRINTADPEVLELQGVVRDMQPAAKGNVEATLTLNVGEEVCHVQCLLPGPWLWGRRRQVTDLVRVHWRRGEMRAVAAQTISDGQLMFILGFAGLAAAVLLYILLL